MYVMGRKLVRARKLYYLILDDDFYENPSDDFLIRVPKS